MTPAEQKLIESYKSHAVISKWLKEIGLEIKKIRKELQQTQWNKRKGN